MSATLSGIVREKLGSRHARVLRLQGRIPANVQGGGREDVNFSIEEDVFLAARRHHEHLFDIELDKGETETALVRELQWNTFGERIQHVEFRRVIRGQKTEVEVELAFVGHPKGGILNHLQTHVTIRSIPSKIPDGIEVPVGAMEAGNVLLASQLELPEGVALASDPELQVAVVSAPVSEEPEAGEEGEESETPAV